MMLCSASLIIVESATFAMDNVFDVFFACLWATTEFGSSPEYEIKITNVFSSQVFEAYLNSEGLITSVGMDASDSIKYLPVIAALYALPPVVKQILLILPISLIVSRTSFICSSVNLAIVGCSLISLIVKWSYDGFEVNSGSNSYGICFFQCNCRFCHEQQSNFHLKLQFLHFPG